MLSFYIKKDVAEYEKKKAEVLKAKKTAPKPFSKPTVYNAVAVAIEEAKAPENSALYYDGKSWQYIKLSEIIPASAL